MVVVEDRIFATHADAESAMKSVEACSRGETDAAGATIEQPK
jgi:hypothetical protein